MLGVQDVFLNLFVLLGASSYQLICCVNRRKCFCLLVILSSDSIVATTKISWKVPCPVFPVPPLVIFAVDYFAV
jgi:hypothetical protein